MEDLTFIAENIIHKTEEAENLLYCFLDFYENEGHLSPDASYEANWATAVCFMNREEKYISTVKAALALITEAQKQAEEINNAVHEERRKKRQAETNKIASKVRQNKVISGALS